ncbi:CAT RNA binding domain-containing protein [Anaerostipes hominis (ex Lee et al. 2021)]
MQITRIINNNIVISEDNSHREVVLMGRGLGFRRHPGDVIDSDKVEKTY